LTDVKLACGVTKDHQSNVGFAGRRRRFEFLNTRYVNPDFAP
jgi:hypothetical protein